MTANQIISDLKKLKNPRNITGMAKFGINPKYALGISVANLRGKAKLVGTNHKLALDLWKYKIHEARILATMIDDPGLVTNNQMDLWVNDFNSWDLCDQCCNNLFGKTSLAVDYSFKWAVEDDEFIRRAGFVLMAVLAVHNKNMSNAEFRKYFPIITEYSADSRNFVKKAINWALRQIGKRNLELNQEAKAVCEILIQSESKSSKWIGRDALRELNSEKIISRLKN